MLIKVIDLPHLFVLFNFQWCGSRRLHDTIVLGYQLQRVPGSDLSIPDWYANAENQRDVHLASPTAEPSIDKCSMPSLVPLSLSTHPHPNVSVASEEAIINTKYLV